MNEINLFENWGPTLVCSNTECGNFDKHYRNNCAAYRDGVDLYPYGNECFITKEKAELIYLRTMKRNYRIGAEANKKLLEEYR